MLWLALAGLASGQEPGQASDPGWVFERLTRRINQLNLEKTELEARLAALESRPVAPLWEHFGARADDPNVDNAAAISKALAAGAQALGGVYYCRTPIEWPHRAAGALYGRGGTAVTGQRGLARTVIRSTADPILRYHGSGGVMQDVILEGDGSNVAISVRNDQLPPTGHLTTRSLTINRTRRGLETTLEPLGAWATEFTHFCLRTYDVREPYVVNGSQSCCHKLFACEFRAGYERIFQFTGADGKSGCGGPLYVSDCYVGAGRGGVLLSIANTDSGTGTYEIAGLHTDGTTEDLLLVEHGRRAHRVRVSGNLSSSGSLAALPVVNREGRVQVLNGRSLVDVRVDMRGLQWPRQQ